MQYEKPTPSSLIRDNIGTVLWQNKPLQTHFARPVELPRGERPADFTTSGGLYKECNDTEGQFGIEIARECFRPDVLCSGDLDQKNMPYSSTWGDGTLLKNTILRFHPQHISICKNLTFWRRIWETKVREFIILKGEGIVVRSGRLRAAGSCNQVCFFNRFEISIRNRVNKWLAAICPSQELS